MKMNGGITMGFGKKPSVPKLEPPATPAVAPAPLESASEVEVTDEEKKKRKNRNTLLFLQNPSSALNTEGNI